MSYHVFLRDADRKQRWVQAVKDRILTAATGSGSERRTLKGGPRARRIDEWNHGWMDGFI